MNLTAQEIARLVGGEAHGANPGPLKGAAGLAEAGPEDVTFLKDARKLGELRATKAGAVLVSREIFERHGAPSNGKAFIVVEEPGAAFVALLRLLEKERRRDPEGIHPSAVVHPSAALGRDVGVGAQTVIEEGAVIGDGAKIHAQCYIGRNAAVGPASILYPQVVLREEVRIGARCILHAGAVIGADGYGYLPSRSGHLKVPQVGTVVIEDDVEIGSCTTVDRATTGATRIGRGTKVDNLVQIAHNVQIGPDCLIVAQAGIAGSSRLGARVTLAGQAGVADHVSIGDGAIVGAQGGVAEDLPAGQIYWGTPAQPHIRHKRQLALLRRLPELFRKKEEKET